MMALREKEKVGEIGGARLWILGHGIAREFRITGTRVAISSHGPHRRCRRRQRLW